MFISKLRIFMDYFIKTIKFYNSYSYLYLQNKITHNYIINDENRFFIYTASCSFLVYFRHFFIKWGLRTNQFIECNKKNNKNYTYLYFFLLLRGTAMWITQSSYRTYRIN